MQSVQDMSPISQALGFRAGQTESEGEQSLRTLFENSAEGTRRRAELEEAVELQNYQFNCHGVELGQRYHSRAIADDGTPFPDFTRDPELYYHATTHPGAYLPHSWLEHDRQQVSTLDISGRGQFTLIVGIGGRHWTEAAEKVAADLDIDLNVRTVGYRCEYADVLGAWARIREITDEGCVLVRPDHHIAWRSHGTQEDPVAALRHAIASALARNS